MHEEVIGQRIDETSGVEWFSRLRGAARPKVKRSFDIIASEALLIIIFPVFALIFLVLISTGQSPFYSHTRVGRGGREFGCLKFTSMRRDADKALAELLARDPAARIEWETRRKLRDDPRITRFGKLLRVTSLDEAPQLLNVLKGEMSLVGPRPVTRDEFTKYYSIGEAEAYISVRPGLTGLWQVSGRSGTSYATRVAMDARYAQNLSLRTDLVILLRTLVAVLLRRGAW